MMPHSIQQLRIGDLLLDTGNARLARSQSNQAAALLALAREEGEDLITLAGDIVEHQSLNPMELPGVVAVPEGGPPYVVYEGNRRLAALRLLEFPDQAFAVFSEQRQQRRLRELHHRFEEDPIDNVLCVVFATVGDLDHWVTLRHTGKNQGRGLSPWRPENQDRWTARHGGIPAPRTQVEEFVSRGGMLPEPAAASTRRIVTSIQRVINNPAARAHLGIDFEGPQVLAYFPADEILRSLSKLIEDLKLGRQNSRTLNTAEAVEAYALSLPSPERSKRLDQPVPLQLLTAGLPSPAAPETPPPAPKPEPKRGRAVAPKSTALAITEKRIQAVFQELRRINAQRFPNAAGVLVRVFIEMSVDYYVETHQLSSWRASLSTKMGKAAEHLRSEKKISEAVLKMVRRNIQKESYFDASVDTFHQWVHNRSMSPTLKEIQSGWDELEPFIRALWPS